MKGRAPLAACLMACSGNPTGPCTPEERALIGAEYAAELEVSCPGRLTDCPKYPEIRARYLERRKAWVECKR